MSAERALGGTIFGTRSQHTQRLAKVASDGLHYLVVWNDNRAPPGQEAVYAARVTNRGMVLDPEGILLKEGVAVSAVDVAYDGQDYVVAFGYREPADSRLRISALRLATNGQQTEAPAEILLESEYAVSPALTKHPAGVFLAWSEPYSGRVRGTVLDRGSEHADLNIVEFASEQSGVVQVDVARNARGQLAVWPGWGPDASLRGTFLPDNGQAGPPFVIVGADQIADQIALASDGDDFVVVWRSGADRRVYTTGITETGELRQAEPGSLCGSGPCQLPQLVFTGQNYLALWGEHIDATSLLSYDAVYLGFVAPSGEPAGLDRYGIVNDSTRLQTFTGSLGLGAGELLTVVTTAADKLLGAVVDAGEPSTRLTDIFPIGRAANQQQNPAIAADGEGYLAVWADGRDDSVTGSDLYAVRLDATLSLRDPEPLAVTRQVEDELAPALAYGAGKFLTLWTTAAGGPHATFIAANGQVSERVLDLNPGGSSQGRLAAGFDGTNFAAVWQTQVGSTQSIYAARISPDERLINPAPIELAVAAQARDPALAFGADRYLIAWRESNDGSAETKVIRGVMVDPNGSPSPAFQIAAGDLELTAPAVTFDGNVFLVGWGRVTEGGDADLFLSRVAPSGSVLDGPGIPLASGDSDDRELTLAFDGSMILAAWSRFPGELRLSRFSLKGLSGSPQSVVVDTGRNALRTPVLAVLGRQRAALASQRFSDLRAEKVLRSYVRTLEFQLAAGAPCSEGAQCITGYCSGGVCCDSECSGACLSCADPVALGTCTPISTGECAPPKDSGSDGGTDAGPPPVVLPPDDDRDSQGCGCRVVSTRRSRSDFVAACALAMLVQSVRRRRTRSWLS